MLRILDNGLRERLSKITTERLERGEIKPGRCKWHEYETRSGETIKLLGTYEVRVARALDWNGYRWRKNKDHFRYKDIAGRWHMYTPDFKVFDGVGWFYIEVKGWLDPAGHIKLYDLCSWFSGEIYVLFKEGIEELETGKDPFTENRSLIEVAHKGIERYVSVAQ